MLSLRYPQVNFEEAADDGVRKLLELVMKQIDTKPLSNLGVKKARDDKNKEQKKVSYQVRVCKGALSTIFLYLLCCLDLNDDRKVNDTLHCETCGENAKITRLPHEYIQMNKVHLHNNTCSIGQRPLAYAYMASLLEWR
jgi:hypothetical protein